MAHYLNFAQLYLEKALIWAKKWCSIQNGVLIESGVLLPRIRYKTIPNSIFGTFSKQQVIMLPPPMEKTRFYFLFFLLISNY